MKRIFFATFAFLLSCVCFSQTVVSRSYRIKNTSIEWEISGKDTIYTVPVTEYTALIPQTVFIRFRGSAALLTTFRWLVDADIAEGEIVCLDFTIDKNHISRFSKNFSSGFLLFNKEYELPTSVFWMKKVIKDNYKRLIKYFANGKHEEKQLSKTNDDMYR